MAEQNSKPTPAQAREARLAQALRANLRKRKAPTAPKPPADAAEK